MAGSSSESLIGAGSSSESLIGAGSGWASLAGSDASQESEDEKMKLMIAVANIDQGISQVTNSNNIAFNWILEKIIGTSYDRYKIFLIHVEVPQTRIRKCFSRFRSYVRDCCQGMGALVLSSNDELPDDHTNKIPEVMANFETRCHEKDIECEVLLRNGCPEKIICDEVENVEADLLVLGNRGLSAFQRLFRASVSEYCTKYAECPVIKMNRAPEIFRDLEATHH